MSVAEMTAETPRAALPAPTEVERQLKTAQDLFIRRWGEMGATWGINRTMAEIHALLYIMGQPCCTDDVMDRLNISRGNASMSLRGLCDWGIIRRLHKRGERREYFESLTDVWEIFSIIAAERKRREMDPGARDDPPVPADALRDPPSARSPRKRRPSNSPVNGSQSMEEFMEVTNKIFQQFIGNAKSGLTRVVKVLLKAF